MTVARFFIHRNAGKAIRIMELSIMFVKLQELKSILLSKLNAANLNSSISTALMRPKRRKQLVLSAVSYIYIYIYI